jgi:hypothetical protein
MKDVGVYDVKVSCLVLYLSGYIWDLLDYTAETLLNIKTFNRLLSIEMRLKLVFFKIGGYKIGVNMLV